MSSENVGLVGLGLMGRGIATCLVAHGFSVTGYDRLARQRSGCGEHIGEALAEMVRRGLLKKAAIRNWERRFQTAGSLKGLANCTFIIEAVKEDLAVKTKIFRDLEGVVAPDAVIASNTSSLPISLLAHELKNPERLIGMHWGEPAQIMRYLEIIRGEKTSQVTVERTDALGKSCGKEPSVLRFDIRGFVSNRLMYAMMREAFHLLEAGVADIETIDRSFRNDMGWWATLAGPFRYMDLTGIPAYAAVMDGLLPELCNTKEVPRAMQDVVGRGAKGISNRKGFYRYTPESAKAWERAWVEFTYDIRKVVDKYDKLARS